MKNHIFLLISFLFYELLSKEVKNQDTGGKKRYIEDEEFVYSKIEENKKNDNKKQSIENKKNKNKEISTNKKENDNNIIYEMRKILKNNPSLTVELEDLLNVSKKHIINKSDITTLWEYFIDLNTKRIFDIFNIRKKDKISKDSKKSKEKDDLFNSRISDNCKQEYNKDYLIRFINSVKEDKNSVLVGIHIVSFLIYFISNYLFVVPKINIVILSFSSLMNYYFMNYFYDNNNYFSSFISYFFFIFNIEKLWNSVFSIENIQDIEENLYGKNSFFDYTNFKTKDKFIRKIILSFIILFFSIYVSFTRNRSFYFYIFHAYIFRLIRLTFIKYFKFNTETPSEIQPLENFVDFVIGMFSFTISNLYYYSNLSESYELIGLIIIYNFISFYYILSLDKFLYIYRNGLSDIYHEYTLQSDKNPINQNLNNIPLPKSIQKKENLNEHKNRKNSVNKNSKSVEIEESSDEEITIENLRKFETFQDLADQINLRRYYRIDIFNVGNIADFIILFVSFCLLIFSFFYESLFLIFLSIYLIDLFVRNNAIYISTKQSRIISNIFQIFLMISNYHINFFNFEFLDHVLYGGPEIYNVKITIKILIKFIFFCYILKSFYFSKDFLSYFNIYYYTSYKYILQEGLNLKKINQSSELMFRIKEVFNIKNSLEEIFCFNLEKSINYINYIFENCKFVGKKSDFSLFEISLKKNSKNYNLIFLFIDYFSLYINYWLIYFVFKDFDNIYFYTLFILFKLGIISKFFFLIFEYSKSNVQKFTVIILNMIFYNRIISYFHLFYLDNYMFKFLSCFNKGIYLYYSKNYFIFNCFIIAFEFIEFRKYKNYISLILVITCIMHKSFINCFTRISKKIKIAIFLIFLGIVYSFIYYQEETYFFYFYDYFQKRIQKSLRIDLIGVIEFLLFNCISIPFKFSQKNFEYSFKYSKFFEAYAIKESLKYLIKIKLFIL